MANNRFQVRRSSVPGKVPTTSELNIGEIGLNLTDQIMYSTNGTVVFEIGANTTNSRVSNTLIVKAISANGANGSAGQVLTTNGTAAYWSTVSGGASSLSILDEGSLLTGTANSINFTGSGVTATTVGNDVTVTITSGGALSFTSNVGNAVNTSFTVTHNLNTSKLIPAVRENSSGYYVYPDIKYTSSNTIVLEFVSIPTTDQYFLILLGA